jgi:hypothetical protein
MVGAFEEWSEFNVAVAGAGAALAGLLIVALSVNIKQIAESRGLAARAGAAVAALILGVVLCCAALIPGQVLWGYGVQVLVLTALCFVIAGYAARAVLADPTRGEYHRFDIPVIALFVVPLVLFAVGGVLLAASVSGGLVWVAAGSIVAVVGAIAFSWIALVEVLR